MAPSRAPRMLRRPNSAGVSPIDSSASAMRVCDARQSQKNNWPANSATSVSAEGLVAISKSSQISSGSTTIYATDDQAHGSYLETGGPKMAPASPHQSFLASRRGKLTLALLAAVAFLDFVDASIVNVALPSIRRALHFSVQELQWVPSGYLLTYGGFMLLGGRAADLLGRRRVLVAGASVIGISSMIGGLAGSSAVLIGARLAQGLGAAMTLPAALSILTTSFKEGSDRTKALAVW